MPERKGAEEMPHAIPLIKLHEQESNRHKEEALCLEEALYQVLLRVEPQQSDRPVWQQTCLRAICLSR